MFTLLTSMIVFCLAASSFATIPSFGLQTTTAIRNKLRDRDFRIQFSKGTQIKTEDFSVSIADLSKFPALAGQDVQSFIVRADVNPGGAIFTHYHPRAAETFNALEGTFQVSFLFEGVGPGTRRNVSNVIKGGESTVFPVGLVHDIVCISRTDCSFLAVLHSADPGFVIL